tara:strand:+ start:1901 stop:2809 length:909 start_codon:yes stop_codon:yes gene_type:complete
MDYKSKIILISGSTASGKSNFSLKLSKKINGEIINADSMQVYKELRILTARPKKNQYQNIKHHLYGFQSVKKSFSAGNWLKLAIKKIHTIKKRKKIPILVGGTGLYFKVLIDGIVKIPNIPIKLRNKVRTLHKKLGQKKFYNELIKLDPFIKKKINSSDMQRSIRAYEVKLYTNKSLIKWFESTKSKFSENDFIKIYIDFPRPELLKRISKRTDEMFKQGVIEEVKKFIKLKTKYDKTANKVIGINEIRDFIKKKSDLEETKEKIIIKTRQYAKRQSTWARGHMQNWQKLSPQEIKKFLKKI